MKKRKVLGIVMIAWIGLAILGFLIASMLPNVEGTGTGTKSPDGAFRASLFHMTASKGDRVVDKYWEFEVVKLGNHPIQTRTIQKIRIEESDVAPDLKPSPESFSWNTNQNIVSVSTGVREFNIQLK